MLREEGCDSNSIQLLEIEHRGPRRGGALVPGQGGGGGGRRRGWS